MTIPETLQKQLIAGKVIPFVGAGVSMAVSKRGTESPILPSWHQLLESAADRLNRENEIAYANIVKNLLNLESPDYMDAAKYARKGLGSTWFSFLTEQFRIARENVEEDSLTLPRILWQLGSKLLITTNYDNILRWACPKADDIETWDIQAPANQSEVFSKGPNVPIVWHLHGHIGNTSNLILTPDGYERLYPKDTDVHFNAALESLKHLLTSHTFLFVGFSFSDDAIGTQLKALSEVFQGATGPHYALLLDSNDLPGDLKQASISKIGYPSHGEALITLLESMSQMVTPVSRAEKEAAGEKPGKRYSIHKRVFSVPFQPKKGNLHGRTHLLKQVHSKLNSGQATSIGHGAAFQGLGGLGKTQLAVEYAHEYSEEYKNGVIWINADQDLDSQLIEIALKAEWVSPETKHDDILSLARNRVRSFSDGLVIFDNVESVESVRGLFPLPQNHSHLLVTSRLELPEFDRIPLDLLGADVSFEFLVQVANKSPESSDDLQAAHEIVEMLGGLPIAIELAGAYLRHRETSWTRYRNLLRDNHLLDALPVKFLKSSLTKHDTDLLSTLKVHDSIFDDEPLLREICDIIAWSGTAPLSMELIEHILSKCDSVAVKLALDTGAELRIIQKSPDLDCYSMHRLVAEVRCLQNPLSERQTWMNTICCRLGDWFEIRREDFSELAQFESQIDHLIAWQLHSQNHSPAHLSRLTWLQAYPYYHRGNYLGAQNLIEEALKGLRQEKKRDDKLRAHLLNDLGVTFSALGDHKRALEVEEQALEIRKKLFGENHPDTARSLSNMGGSFYALGDHKRDLEFEEQALKIRKKLFGENHPDTASSLDRVGCSYSNLGDHKRALEFAEQALQIRKMLFPENHPDTARSLDSVGRSYSKLGDHKRALEFAEQALEIRKKLFGENHPETASSLDSVGRSYSNLGDNNRALEFAEQALQIRKMLFPENHPDTARSLDSVGRSYSNLGDNKRALEFAEQALEIRKKLFGENHPDTARSLHNLGVSYSNLGDNKHALELKEQALQIQKKFFDHNHPNVKQLKAEITKLMAKLTRPGFRKPPKRQEHRKKKRKR